MQSSRGFLSKRLGLGVKFMIMSTSKNAYYGIFSPTFDYMLPTRFLLVPWRQKNRPLVWHGIQKCKAARAQSQRPTLINGCKIINPSVCHPARAIPRRIFL